VVYCFFCLKSEVFKRWRSRLGDRGDNLLTKMSIAIIIYCYFSWRQLLFIKKVIGAPSCQNFNNPKRPHASSEMIERRFPLHACLLAADC
jgi:hypothetical protein